MASQKAPVPTSTTRSATRPADEPAPGSPSYHHGNLRAALIEAGLKALETRSAHELSLRDLARQVGVSANAAYRHFADKEELLMALAAEGFRRFTTAQVAALRPGASAEVVFRCAGRAYVDFARGNPALFHLMFGRFPATQQRSAELQEASDLAFSGLQGMAASHAGLPLNDPRVRLRALTAWSLVHGLSHLVLDGQLEKFGDEAEPLVDTLLQCFAMTPDGAPEP